MFSHTHPSTHAISYAPSTSRPKKLFPDDSSSESSVQGTTPTPQVPPVAGIALLKRYISGRSMLQGIVRDAPATCHPETRRGILNTILSWVNKPSPHESVLWVFGEEGVGKSAIMQTIPGIVTANHRDRYAGGYFISEGIYTRRESRTFIPTLAYQIAENLPGMREIIDSAMASKPNLPMESMQTQMEHLIVIPLQKSSVNFSHHTPLILVDGLDECEGPDTLKQIMSIISHCIRISAPLRFLLAGRPVDMLRETFSQDPLLLVTKEICLDSTDNNMQVQTDADIERFYNAEFASIYDKKWLWPLSSINHDVPKPWPSTDDIRLLTFSASGNFLYASTITAYIRRGSRELGDPYTLFQKLLRTIRTFHCTLALDITELDILYMSILSLYPRQESLLSVLAGVLLRFHPNVIKAFFQVEEREIQTVLEYLDPLLRFNHTEQKLEDHDPMANVFGDLGRRTINVGVTQGHRSFREFLLDSRRSGTAFHPKFISNNRSPDLIDTIKNARSTYADTPLISIPFHFTGTEFWTKDFLCIAAHSLLGIQDDAVFPPLLTLFFRSRDFVLNTLANRDINSLIPEMASLLVFLHYIQRHTEYLWFGESLPEDVMAAIHQILYPKTVQWVSPPNSLDKIMDALRCIMDKYSSGEAFQDLTSSQSSRTHATDKCSSQIYSTNTVPARPQRSEAVTIKKPGLESDTSPYVHYQEPGRYFTPPAVCQPKPAPCHVTITDGIFKLLPPDPSRVQRPAPKSEETRNKKGTSSTHQNQNSHGVPSAPRLSVAETSSSGQGGRTDYSHASSRTRTTEYGLFYKHWDISGNSWLR